jgi:hypothetical protein
MGLHTPWEDMKRCVLNADGTVNYYLDPTDSTLKADGSAAVLDGADGNVMVEIPKFWFKHELNGSKNTWRIRTTTYPGYQVHPAFIKAGAEVSHRYIGAYDACYLDATDSTYKSGLNLTDMTSNLDLANDKLASVSGVYPLVGVTRDECRSLAENNGTGWHQLDFALWSAIQMLFLVEYGDFKTQAILGAGNTGASYLAGESQTDSPHSVAGKSNALGNASTDTTSGASSASRDTAYMSYRGIENWYGNCRTWADGINVNQGTAGNVYVANDYTDFADNTTTNYTLVSSAFPTATGYIQNILNTGAYFLSGDNTGGSSTTYLADEHFASVSLLSRVVAVGGNALIGAGAGGFALLSIDGAGDSFRSRNARLAF